MIALDHIALWSRNHYRSTFELSQETGLGNLDGGFFPVHGLGQKIVPLGGHMYIEVEGVIDFDVFTNGSWIADTLERNTIEGDYFMGWCLGSDSLDEIEAFAAHRGVEPQHGIDGGKYRMTGPSDASKVILTPSVRDSWAVGKPNMYLVSGFGERGSGLTPQPGTGDVVAQGVAWIEIGGTRDDLLDWLGPIFDSTEAAIDIRYNGGSSGLHALGVNTSEGEREIRRRPRR